MVKSVIKEIIIILLLIVALLLALGVLFYDYIPNNKTVPNVGVYRTSDSVQEALEEQIVEDETVLVTYEITSDDLRTLKNTNSYENGKSNPFSTYEKPAPEVTDPNDPNYTGDPNSIGTNVPTANGGQTSNNTFYSNTGTK